MTERELESQVKQSGNHRADSRPVTREEMIDAARGGAASSEGGGAWKSKRRSFQPKEGRESRQKWFIGLLLGVVLPIVGGVLLWAAAGYYRCESDAFRRDLAENLSKASGFKVHVGRIEVQGLNLSAPNLSFSQGNGVVRYAEFRNLRATVAPASFFGGNWKIHRLRVDEADVHFSSTEAVGESVLESRGRGELRILAAGFGLGVDPGSWSLDAVQVRSLNLFWKERKGSDSWVRASRLTATNFSDESEVRLSGGAASAWGFSPLNLDYAEFRFGDENIEIVRARLREKSSNSSNGAGTVQMKGVAGWEGDELVKIEIDVQQLDLEEMVSESWVRRLGGRISADLTYEGRLRGGGDGVATGTIQIEDGWLRNLTVLDALAEASGESRFRELQLDEEFGGTVTVRRGGVSLENLKAEGAGLIRIAGALEWEKGGALSGELEVGLPAAVLDRFSGGRPNYFGAADEGFCSARLVASGSLDSPTESLSGMLLASTGSAIARPSRRGAPPARNAKEDDAVPALEGRSEKRRLEELFRALLD